MSAKSAQPSGSFELVPAGAGELDARGVLTFSTARRAWMTGLNSLNAATERELRVNCAGITAVDSAGLAVLLDWLAAAKRAGRSLHFTHLPAELQGIARIGEVEQFL